ncbi:tetratricopeptide repeat protein [Microbulbifer sp. OS29]|uniref:Ancillary SecYEG translocon subunit n=1 Tax=Microbulbifer okhotskensis TaxID=2926617 RepID=A0A9X2ELL9_9GAMM|nr:tetratricopeptide repeat protein [Microbulbifer okhotskensis]MCO1333835.1 tetratricopeptide repeat protein [Microbulbifer okhotskensis]
MSEHLTEQEQIETLKRWWAENGKGILTGVALALAGYFGYQWWQGDQRSKAEAASDLYQTFVEAASANNNQPDNKQLTTAKNVAEQLKEDFTKRIYASQAALRLAAIAAESNDLETAQQQLQWAIDNTDETSLELLAKRRLAAVLAARGKPDDALKLLEGTIPPAFAALYSETRGDILKQKGDSAGARAAYEQALSELLPEQAGSTQLLRLKADSLAAVEGVEEQNQTEPVSEGDE